MSTTSTAQQMTEQHLPPAIHCDPEEGCLPLKVTNRRIDAIEKNVSKEETTRREDVRAIHGKIDGILIGVILLLLAAVANFILK